MSNTLINNIVTAYGIKGETLASRVFSVGAARAEGLSTEDIFLQAQDVAQGNTGIVFDGFSTSTLNNAFTSFNIFLKNAGLSVPATKAAVKGVIGTAATRIEQARSKHGKKVVVQALVEFMTDSYTSEDQRASHVIEVMDTLIGLDSDDAKRPKTPEERFIAALKTAENLLATIELSDEQADQAQSILASLNDVV